MDQWANISDASVFKIKQLLIQYADVQKTINPRASGGVLTLASKTPGDITLNVNPKENGVIKIEIRDKITQKTLSEFSVGTAIPAYTPQNTQNLLSKKMGEDFKNGAPSYVQVLEATGTTIKLKTAKPDVSAKGSIGLSR